MKVGTKVKILTGPHRGNTGKIASVFVNGAMVERDGSEGKRFTIVQFVHLEEIKE